MNTTDSKALQEVWEWKELAYKEVEHLSIAEALTKRLADSLHTVCQLGFPVSEKLHELPMAHVANQ